jgi:DNA-binding transcriptional MerR regulator
MSDTALPATPAPHRGGPSLGVGDAARRLGVSVDTLRYYEREQLLSTSRTASGHRRYSQGDLDWLAVLTCLRETGMPMRRLREFAALVRDDRDESLTVRLALLEQHRAEVLARIREVRANLAHVEAKITYYRSRTDQGGNGG